MLSFDDILGQEHVKSHIQNALADGKISHAYILCGEDGSGKMMLAERFAAALQCDGGSDSRPCGSCIACMQSESHNHPDIIYVSHEKANISVDDIRVQLVNDVSVKPYSGQYKVYIIDEAEKMNEHAQNALLKTLEEPPAYAVILLLATNTGAFLPTILSRCITLQLKPIDNDTIRQYLISHYELPDYYADLCASFSCGCIGRAIKYAQDPDFKTVRDDVLRLVRRIDSMKQNDIMDTLESFNDEKKRASIDDYFDLIGLWFRDVLIYKATQDPNRLLFSDELSEIGRQASVRSFEALNNISLAIDKARQRLKANVYFDVAMELLLMALKEY